MYAVIYYIGWG